jgi:indole-3-glycerol phosphate synthase
MYLKDILDYKRMEIADFKKKHSFSEFENKIVKKGGDIFFEKLKKKSGLGIIAEIKKASPSRGIICSDFNHKTVAKDYETIGVDAISILTDEKFFCGHIDFLRDISGITDIPLLRKDFIIDEIQIFESKASGADAILLIVAALNFKRLMVFNELCAAAGIVPVIEIHNEEELKIAMDCGARVLGINNRDLNTFKIDLETSVRLIPKIPCEYLRISESGIETREHIKKIRKAGADAFLIGTAFMQAKDKGAFFKGLIDES